MRTFSSVMRVCALLAGILLLSAGSAWAQVGTAAVYGDITDPKGLAIVGAKVTVTNQATGLMRTKETDTSGHYEILALPPGTYKLRVEMKGFRTAVADNVNLAVDTTTKASLALEVGSVSETVIVSEVAAPLNTHDASLGNVLLTKQIGEIPLEGRSIVALLSLQPGATFLPVRPQPGQDDMRSGSISGSRSDQTNITLDGVDINDPQNQTTAYQSSLRVTAESLQEFRVTTSNYDATEGRSSAAQVSLITKSGTNTLHGSLYWYHRNTATSSNEYFSKLAGLKTPKLLKHNFGGSISGAILKDRIFYFGNLEALRQISEVASLRSVPSASFRDGVLIYRCRTASDSRCQGGTVSGLTKTFDVPAGFFGVTPAQFAAIDPTGIGVNQAAVQYFQQYPLPNDPGRDGFNIMGFRFNAPIENKFYTGIARFDFKLDAAGNHNLYTRGTYQHDFFGSDPQFAGQPPRDAHHIEPKGVAVGYSAVITPRLLSTLRYGYTWFKDVQQGQRSSNISHFRFITDFLAQTPTNARSFSTHNIVEDMSYTHGSHTLQFGANLRFSRLPRFTNANSFHTAIANGSWLTGVGRRYLPGRSTCTTPGCSQVPAVASNFFAVWADSSINLWGILSQGTANYNYNKDGSTLPNGAAVARRYASNEFEFYIQDSWRLRPNLTVNYGVRYSLFSPPWEVNGLQVAPTPSFGEFFELRRRGMLAGIPSNQVPRISFDLAGPANQSKGYYPWDYNNFAPRLSIAYSPHLASGPLGWLTGNGKMVIRSGYSLVYDRIGQALATSFDSGGSFGMSTNLTNPFGQLNEITAPRFTGFTNLPGAPLIAPAPPGGFPSTPPFGLFAITNSIDDTNRTPYAHMFDFGIGRELPGNMTLEIAYVGRRGRYLLSKWDLAMPLNLVDPASKMDYFTAASKLAVLAEVGDPIGFTVGTPVSQVPTIPYWENLFPGMVGNPICDVNGLGPAAYNTATKAVYDLYLCFAPDYTTALQFLDQGGLCDALGSCSKFGPFAYFHDQYSSLAAQSTIGRSEYHGMQLTLRKQRSHGIQFDFNYSLSKSLDLTSEVERGSNFGDFFAGGYSEFLVNSWNPNLNYSHSTFDMRHQLNLHWVAELPFGRGRWLGKNASGVVNAVIGGWDFAGLWRWTSGLPFNVINCRSCWPTNWNLQGNASLFGGLPATGTTRNAVGKFPSPFKNPTQALAAFRRSRPGEVGIRNLLRGDGYFTIDTGLSKTWAMPYSERHKLKFRWEVFNLTNTPKFDTGFVSATPDLTASFGRYNNTLAACDGAAGRCMQFALRYEF